MSSVKTAFLAKPLRPSATVPPVLLALTLTSCGGGTGSGGNTPSRHAGLSAMALVGQQIFSDTALSASGRQACATCHVAAKAFAGAEGLPVPLGGPNMDLPGLRATPSLMYASYTPAFAIAADGTPTGSLFRDGRASNLAEQAQAPFVSPFEMANVSPAEVRARLLTRPYLDQFTAVFGAAVLDDATQTLASIGAALAAYESEDTDFRPFNSKFDAYQAGTVTLSPAELQGLQLFNNPAQGNCNACHPSTRAAPNVLALFTDFTYDSVGLPRNWPIAANQAGTPLPYVPQNGAALGEPNLAYYDIGLCGPQRTGLADRHSWCGAFKVPTLRNAAVKQNYFHSGAFDNLNDAVTCYATSDTDPTRWYRQADGSANLRHDDLPVAYQASMNIAEVPYNPGLAPALTGDEINLIVVFLCTLTDGYDPARPSAYGNQAQCQQAAARAATSADAAH